MAPIHPERPRFERPSLACVWMGALLALLTVSPAARAEPPPYLAALTAWANAAGYRLSDYTHCRGLEEQLFGSLGSVCWTAKHVKRDVLPDLHSRLRFTLAVYPDEAAAKARMARFAEEPASLRGEEELLFPLRAGFRLGERVLLVTTDAVAFEPAMVRAARDLSGRTGGTDLACWGRCPR